VERGTMKKTYAYHKPSPQGIEQIAALRKGFSEFQELIESIVPANSRERALCFTHLEEASMWINKAIILDDPQSEVDPDATFGKSNART
jgi:hypothetical protein